MIGNEPMTTGAETASQKEYWVSDAWNLVIYVYIIHAWKRMSVGVAGKALACWLPFAVCCASSFCHDLVHSIADLWWHLWPICTGTLANASSKPTGRISKSRLDRLGAVQWVLFAFMWMWIGTYLCKPTASQFRSPILSAPLHSQGPSQANTTQCGSLKRRQTLADPARNKNWSTFISATPLSVQRQHKVKCEVANCN